MEAKNYLPKLTLVSPNYYENFIKNLRMNKMQITFEGVHGNDTVYMDCLRAICGETSELSMIDLGCNLAPHTPKLGFKKRTYVDVLDRKLDHENEQQFFKKQDMLYYLREGGVVYDFTFSLDSIEHLTVTNGAKLIRLMEDHSHTQVIFTPLNPWMMDLEGTEPEGHHSLWTPDLLPDFASIVFPDYHNTLGIGAWFGFKSPNIASYHFDKVVDELNKKSWAKSSK